MDENSCAKATSYQGSVLPQTHLQYIIATEKLNCAYMRPRALNNAQMLYKHS